MHVQRMLKTGRGLYTGGSFKQNIWGKEKENWGPYLRHDLINERFGANFFFIKIYYVTTACTTYTFTFGKCWLIEN